MRSRKAANEHVAEVARRRLELLATELAEAGRTPEHPGPGALSSPGSAERPGSGELLAPGSPHAPASPQRSAHGRSATRSDLRSLPPADATPAPVRQTGIPRPGRHAQRSVALSARVLGWLHDRLPPTLQGRVQLGSSHLTVVALLVAAALAVTAWSVVRADGDGTVVPAAAAAAAGGSPSLPVPAAAAEPEPATTTGQASSSSTPVVIVDVAGKVRRPGIATLPVGSRVVDALKAAGGARRGVDVTTLNLARLLVDGEQIVVGVPAPGGVAAPAASAPGASPAGPLVNLNSATQAELETLPGVGPVTATAILQWRTDNGAFTAVDELLEVSGIGEATLAEMAPFVTL